jgi:hypothetical protein
MSDVSSIMMSLMPLMPLMPLAPLMLCSCRHACNDLPSHPPSSLSMPRDPTTHGQSSDIAPPCKTLHRLGRPEAWSSSSPPGKWEPLQHQPPKHSMVTSVHRQNAALRSRLKARPSGAARHSGRQPALAFLSTGAGRVCMSARATPPLAHPCTLPMVPGRLVRASLSEPSDAHQRQPYPLMWRACSMGAAAAAHHKPNMPP